MRNSLFGTFRASDADGGMPSQSMTTAPPIQSTAVPVLTAFPSAPLPAASSTTSPSLRRWSSDARKRRPAESDSSNPSTPGEIVSPVVSSVPSSADPSLKPTPDGSFRPVDEWLSAFDKMRVPESQSANPRFVNASSRTKFKFDEEEEEDSDEEEEKDMREVRFSKRQKS